MTFVLLDANFPFPPPCPFPLLVVFNCTARYLFPFFFSFYKSFAAPAPPGNRFLSHAKQLFSRLPQSPNPPSSYFFPFFPCSLKSILFFPVSSSFYSGFCPMSPLFGLFPPSLRLFLRGLVLCLSLIFFFLSLCPP